MNVTRTVGGEMVCTMSADELGIIRYALNVGVEKLKGDARYFAQMQDVHRDSAADTAKKAQDASDALEAATQEWVNTIGL